MAIKLEEMFEEFRYPSTITTNKPVDFSGSSAVTLPAATVTGSQTTLKVNYATIAVPTNGTDVAVNVFGQSTAPIAGTITGFWTVAASTVTGTCTLFGTTAGTVGFITYGSTVGLVTGTAVVNAAVSAGDTVTIKSSTSGTCTAYITFQTKN